MSVSTHTHGYTNSHLQYDFQQITRFEDQVKVCETIGVVLTEEAKVFYFMNNLNDSIFGTVKANFMELSTRGLFPDLGVRTNHPEKTSDRAKSNQGWRRQALRWGELQGWRGHFYRSCKHYNKEFSVEANRKYFLKNQSKKDKKWGHEEEKASNDRGAPRGGGGGGGGHGNSNNGRGGRANNTTAQGGATSSETQAEQARFARELDTDGIDNAHLDAKEKSLVCRWCDSGTIDLLLDTGTVSNLVLEDQRDVVQDIRSELLGFKVVVVVVRCESYYSSIEYYTRVRYSIFIL